MNWGLNRTFKLYGKSASSILIEMHCSAINEMLSGKLTELFRIFLGSNQNPITTYEESILGLKTKSGI